MASKKLDFNRPWAPAPGIGPRRVAPHPDGDRGPKLLTCPTCRNKGLLYYYAPQELGYVTECIKCGRKYSYRAVPETPTDRHGRPSLTPNVMPVLRRDERSGAEVLDANKLWNEILERRGMGWRRWRALGKEKRVNEKGRLE